MSRLDIAEDFECLHEIGRRKKKGGRGFQSMQVEISI